MLDSARELRPLLREQQKENAERGGYSEKLHEHFTQAGFYDLLVPSMYGGLNLGIKVLLQVGIEISRGDPGTGWSFMLGVGNVYQAASFFPRPAQDVLFAYKPVVLASRGVPEGTARPVEGGFILDGVWHYNSGSTWSTHAMPFAPVLDDDDNLVEHRFFLLHRDQFELLDDWGGGQTIGLEASGSNSIRVSELFVPYHLSGAFNSKNFDWSTGRPEGFLLHDDSNYIGRNLFVFYASLLATQVGAAWAMLDEYEVLMATKQSSFPPRMPRSASNDYLRWYGDILSKTEAAEALLIGLADRFERLNEDWMRNGVEFTAQEDSRLRSAVLQASLLIEDAISLAFRTAGSSSTFHGSRIERYYRDNAMYQTHTAAQLDVSNTATARFLLHGELTN